MVRSNYLALGQAVYVWKYYRAKTGFLLALLPPGAFIALGFLIALKNKINTEIERRSPEIEPENRTCPSDPVMNAQKRKEIFKRLQEDNPQPTTELNLRPLTPHDSALPGCAPKRA